MIRNILSLVSLSLLGGSFFLAALVVMVTATVWQTGTADEWTVLMLPLPFGPVGVLGLLFGGLSLRDAAE